ncbi:FAD:protein FMN transferase [Prosthecobacter sp.]|uniref:FAD:protein FMN transferase n=1 Tax=Prosthecobacter sp. TaxID=1965333 RepID=UPI0037843F92
MRFAFLLLLLCGCSRDDPPVALGGRTMGTTWSLKVYSPTYRTVSPSFVQTKIQHQLDEWENILSHWRPDSAVSRFNASSSTDWISVPGELVEVVELAQQIGNETDHALDITLAPLIDLWGFGATGRREVPPTEAEIAKAKAQCGWQRLHTRHEPPALRKDIPELRINVSAVAEGWAMDKIARQLELIELSNFLFEIGGEVLARGEWRVGVQTPAAPPGEAAHTLLLKNQSIATSGVYRQHFGAAGKEYSHILDPRNGRPIEHSLESVTVVDDFAAQADGFATALMVLGPKEGRRVAAQYHLNVVWFEHKK